MADRVDADYHTETGGERTEWNDGRTYRNDGVDIARELAIPRVLVPLHPGITSAMGLLASDLKHETQRTVNLAILDGVDVVYVERCRAARPGQQEIDLNLHVGARLA